MKKLLVRGALACAIVPIAGFFVAEWRLRRPRCQPVGPPPSDLAIERVTVASGSGNELAAWFVLPGGRAATATPPDPVRGGVVLVHGIDSCRKAMVTRARFLARAGYASLLVDLQAHGESTGEVVTFGKLEALDVVAGIAWLREKLPAAPLAAIAESLGGAALVLAPRPLGLDAIVLEAVFPTIEQATFSRARFALGEPGVWLARLALPALRWRMDLTPADLRPIDHVASLGAPLLWFHGGADPFTPLAEAQETVARAREPKKLVVLDGAGHVDLHAFDPARYEAEVLAFFEATLRRPAPSSPGNGGRTAAPADQPSRR